MAVVDAPVGQVWRLLADPALYDRWWEARTVSIVPEGPAHAGQRIVAHAGALGLHATIHLTVQSIDPEKHRLELLTEMPFGITMHNVITCTPAGGQQARLSFG